jgi:hypothetical protein
VKADFVILSVAPAAAGVGGEVCWECDAGIDYDLQFSPDLSLGSFANVGSTTATGPVSMLTHDPGAASSGHYRVVKHLP